MVRRLFISLMIALSVAAAAKGADVVPKGWEAVSEQVRSDGKTIVKEQDIEIVVNGAAIVVTTATPVRIKVFSILGRVVSDSTVPAGISRLVLPAHGVYIVKTDSMTCKVAV